MALSKASWSAPTPPESPRAVLTYAEPGTCPASTGLSFFEHKQSLGHEAGGVMLTTDAHRPPAQPARHPSPRARIACRIPGWLHRGDHAGAWIHGQTDGRPRSRRARYSE